MQPLTFGSLFAGIGGFDLGFERAGMKCLWQVEKDEFCRKVLAKHWPDVPKYEDVKDCGKHNLKPVDIICGGFPFQPFSKTGKRQGRNDDRYLWPEMLRIIQELRPTTVIGENVPNILNMGIRGMFAEMEAEGYEGQGFILPACGINTKHRRDRVFFIFNAIGRRPQDGWPGSIAGMAGSGETWQASEDNLSEVTKSSCIFRGRDFTAESGLRRVADGISSRLDRNLIGRRNKALGNAVVPLLAQTVGVLLQRASNNAMNADKKGRGAKLVA